MAATTMAAVAIPALLRPQLGDLPGAGQLAVCLAAAAAGWFAMIIITGHPLKQEIMRLPGAWRRLRAPGQTLPV
jgi:hypothetical protein